MEKVDVVIVGAGLAGLCCAFHLAGELEVLVWLRGEIILAAKASLGEGFI
jgi:flavin-dependent dehydrogenase